MDGGEFSSYITADRGGIAAGRDVHIACTLDICPRCETRLIRRGQSICRCCARAARLARIQRDGTLALFGYGVCVAIGLQCLAFAGYRNHWFLAAMIGVLVFGAGYCAWLRAMIWMQRDALRQLRACGRVLRQPRRWRLTRMLRDVPMRVRSMIATSRRVPGSDEEKRMEPNAEDAARAAKIVAEASKLVAQSAMINAQARWFPVMVTFALFAAAILLVRFLL